ncbi:MAG: metallophosphoesterase [Bacteroidota bacterium]
MRVGVVSDIHGAYEALRRAVQAMGPVDLLAHAGDGYSDLIRWRKENPDVRVEMVAGNCDLFADCAEETLFSLDRWRILLTHGHQYGVKSGLHRLLARAQRAGAQLVIYGHTHCPERSDQGGIILFNPGSLCLARTSCGRPSYGLIDVTPDRLEIAVDYL